MYRGRTAGDETLGAKCIGDEMPKGRSDSGANCRGRNAGGETSVNRPDYPKKCKSIKNHGRKISAKTVLSFICIE